MKANTVVAVALFVIVSVAPPAQAQFAVIDIASVTQLVQQAQTLEQELQAARAQVSQAQSLYQSMTGARGMEQLLADVTRNYLPTDWSQLSAALTGGANSALASGIAAAVNLNAVLSSAQLAALSTDEQNRIGAGRDSVALLQALAQQALSNSSGRFESLQQLIGAIPAATDQKGILELQARVGAEQTMLQNEQTKLQVLYQAAQSQSLAVQQREREQVIAGHGHFATRFEPTLR